MGNATIHARHANSIKPTALHVKLIRKERVNRHSKANANAKLDLLIFPKINFAVIIHAVNAN